MAKNTRPKSSRSDERLARDDSAVREDREDADRALAQDQELTDEQRLDALRGEYFQQTLPNLPTIPGYHVCWLTTQNGRDPVHGRMRLGYEPIKASEVPGYEHSSLKTGEYAGCIGVNEMVAFKLPDRLYQKYMRESHHDEPARQEELLQEAVKQAQESAARVNPNIQVIPEQGTRELGKQAVKAPIFN